MSDISNRLLSALTGLSQILMKSGADLVPRVSDFSLPPFLSLQGTGIGEALGMRLQWCQIETVRMNITARNVSESWGRGYSLI